jgi:hypothetical protein
MQINKPVPSEQLRQAFLSALPRFLHDLARIKDVGDVVRGLPAEYAPLQVHTLRLDDLVRKADIASAKKAGWRFLAGGKKLGQPVAADVTEPSQDIPPKMTSLSHGPQISEFLQAVLDLLPLVQAECGAVDSYELRILSIPGILIEAFWLKSPAGDQDLVVPYRNLSRELKGKQVYPMDEFLRIIQPLAEKGLQYRC